MINRIVRLTSLLILLPFFLCSQSLITVNGRVTDADAKQIGISACIVVNMRTQQGVLADEDGKFSITVLKTDTLAFRTIGYNLKFIRLADSLFNANYFLNVLLKRQTVMLSEVMIIPAKTPEKAEADIKNLGFRKEDYMLGGVDALQSPITYLYQLLSKKERSKREVAFMINEDERKEILSGLLQHYVASNFISLNQKDFSPFINYCAFTDTQLKTLSQYELAVYIKRKLQLYKQAKPD